MTTMAKIPPGVGPRFPQAVVLVGATGDLARRKLLPGLFHLCSTGFIPACRIIGVSLDELDADGFRAAARSALDEFGSRKVEPEAWDAFAATLDYVPLSGGADALRAAVERAETSLGTECRRLHYLSVPPNAALPVVRMLGEAGLVERARIVMEKPFGTDLASAVLLNSRLHEVFQEEQIFRIDHFLGKEAAQNILAFRFANGLFEPIWNRNFIDHVQIDVPETLGLGKRAGFYEQTGAYRDMVVTHLFQILGFMAMEPPTSLDPQPIGEEKNKVFRSMLPIQSGDVVRGQYSGYRSEDGVDPDSDAETFIALKCHIDNWRWAGVPFYIRTGKRLAAHEAHIAINFRATPHPIYRTPLGTANRLVIHLQPRDGVALHLFAAGQEKRGARISEAQALAPVHLDLDFEQRFGTERVGAYERLLLDVIAGRLNLFVRADEQEAAWRWVEPIMQAWRDSDDGPRPYAAGSWGPSAASAMVAREGHTWMEET